MTTYSYGWTSLREVAAFYKNPRLCIVYDEEFDTDEVRSKWESRATLLNELTLVCEEEDALFLGLTYYYTTIMSIGEAIIRYQGMRAPSTAVEVHETVLHTR